MNSSAPLYASYTNQTTVLCPYNEDTPKLFEKWFSDQQLIAAMGDWDFYPLPYYEQTPEEYVRRTRRATWLVGVQEETGITPIGYTGLYMQPRHRVGILRLAIAESAFRNQGHGFRATMMALEWGFRSLNLFSVHLSTTASNRGAVALYQKCGFRECGRYKLSRYEPDGRFDEIHMELLREDWAQLNQIKLGDPEA